MSKFNKSALSLLALILFVGVQIGCETTKGAGKDIEHTGDAIQDAAD